MSEHFDELLGDGDDTADDPVGDFIAGLEEDASVSWQSAVYQQVKDTIKSMSKSMGVPEDLFMGWFESQAAGMIDHLTRRAPSVRTFGDGSEPWAQQGPDSVIDYSDLYRQGLEWLGLQDSSFQNLLNSWSVQPKGGGGSGPPRLTAKNFDLDSLAMQATDMWRAYLLEEPQNARDIASAFMNAKIADPEQAMDYETFVYNQIKKSGRYQSIYRNKPEALSETAFISPYMETAMRYVRPRDAADIAAGGAALGADPHSFQSRVMRDNAVRKSAPFITGMEDMLSQVRGVLVG